MSKKSILSIIAIIIVIILILLITRCGTDSSMPGTAMDKVTKGIGNASGNLGNKVTGLANSAKDSVSNTIDATGDKLGSAAENLTDSAKNVTGKTIDAASNSIGKVGSTMNNMSGSAQNAASNALNSAENTLKSAATTTGNIADSVKGRVSNTMESGANTVNNLAEGSANMVKGAGDKLNTALIERVENTTETLNSLSPSITNYVESEVVLEGITFKINSAELDSSSFIILDRVANKLQQSEKNFEIAGYTDNTGIYDSNLQLSQSRANTVMNFLIANGIDSNRLSAKGYGSESPVADNSSIAGRSANRRVELQVR